MNFIKQYYPYVEKDIRDVIGYIPISLLIALACCLVAMVLYRILTKRWCWEKVLSYFLFVVYVAVVIQIAYLSREAGSRIGTSFSLGETWGHSLREHAYLIENVMFFVPFGILFPLLGRIAKYICIPVAICSTVAIEGMQYITQRGYCQLDDMVMNTIGACIGYAIIMLIMELYKLIHNRKVKLE